MTPSRPAPRPPLAGSLFVGLLCSVAALHPAHAGSTFGSLANFDAVNDTGKSAYGFEIEFEDAHFFKSQVGSVFGLNRVFPSVSPNPLAVVRFGSVRVEDYNDALGNHAGVHIVYGGTPGGVFTPANNPASPFHTPGESCWPGANRGWASNPCDHFGVTTAGSPALTRYSWLVQSAANPAVLERQALGIPAVNFAYTPPPPPPPPPPPGSPPPPPPPPAILDVQIRAVAPNPEQPENIAMWGDPYWVKTYTTKVPRNIDLGNLLRGDPDVEAADVETEWSIFQRAPAGHVGANEVKEVQLQLGDADKSVIRRYEFFHYTGPRNVDGSGEVDCNTGCEVDPLGLDANQDHFGQSFVGNFVGAQMAGFNVNQAAAVPEPQTWAAMLGGLAVLALRLRRRTR